MSPQTPGNTIPGAGGWGASAKAPMSGTGLYAWGTIVGAGVLGLTAAGKLFRPALALQIPTRLFATATRPINWAAYNAYREVGDFVHWAKGGEMELGIQITGRPWVLPTGVPVVVPFPWLDIQPSQSSGGGGPGGLPNLHRPPLSIEETGEILSNPPMVGGKTGSPPDYNPPWLQKGRERVLKKTRCPKGWRWSYRHRRCVKITRMYRRRERKG